MPVPAGYGGQQGPSCFDRSMREIIFLCPVFYPDITSLSGPDVFRQTKQACSKVRIQFRYLSGTDKLDLRTSAPSFYCSSSCLRRASSSSSLSPTLSFFPHSISSSCVTYIIERQKRLWLILNSNSCNSSGVLSINSRISTSVVLLLKLLWIGSVT